jgi:hypothetical protein
MKRNSGYKGSTTFEFEVERYKNNQTGELIFVNSIPDDAKESDFEYQCITLVVEGNSYFTPGRTYGDPNDCYPDEGETEITSLQGPDGKDWSNDISDSEKDSILDMITTQSEECDSGCEREYERDDDRDNSYYDPSWDNYSPSY